MAQPLGITVAKPRPTPHNDDRKDLLLQVRVSETLRDDAQAEADALGVSLSDFVRMAIIEKIARQKRERQS